MRTILIVSALAYPDVSGWMFGNLIWKEVYSSLPEPRRYDLALRPLQKPNRDEFLLDVLSMKLHGEESSNDFLGVEYRRIGLVAAAARLLRNKEDPAGSTDPRMKLVVGAALSFTGNEEEKEAWVNAIFSAVDEGYGYIHTLNGAIQATAEKLPGVFLDRVFSVGVETQERRRFFIEWGGMGRLPLGKVGIDILIDWCRKRAIPDAWPVVAASIQQWAVRKNGEPAELSEAALKFVEAAPDPYAVVSAFAMKIEPRVSSGDRSGVMHDRLNAINALSNHPRNDISAAAILVVKEASGWIEAERRRESRRDEEREQRFE